jgi:putative MFS transporter
MNEERLSRFLWLPPGARPPMPLPKRQELVFLLVGTTFLFSGYDLNIYGMAIPQIQQSLHIPENAVAPIVAQFRLAAIGALLFALSADIFGRRRLLLFTVFFEAILTAATAFVQTRAEFVAIQTITRVFGYTEEMLCIVVIAEEIDARIRGWATGVIAAMGSTGAGLAALLFSAVNYLPFGWRSLYFIGGSALLILAYYRRLLPETKRFEIRREEVEAMQSKIRAGADTLRRLLLEYPGRLTLLVISLFSFGFAIAPSTVLMSKFLQQTHHYTPGGVGLLFVTGGFVAVIGNVLAGRISDTIGRKTVIVGGMLTTASFFAIFFSGYGGPWLPAVWIVAMYGYFSADALMAGLAVELFPTSYRATMGGLRYLFVILGGALGLTLEGRFYDWFGAHGPAISLSLAVIPVAVLGVLFLPEPARRVLEDIAPELNV